MNLKKIIIIIIIIFLINPIIIYANEIDEELNVSELQEVIETSTNMTTEPYINSKAAIVIDRESKSVLYSKNSDVKTAMASTTKIMTAIITLEKGNLSDIVTVSQRAALTGGSRLGLKTKDEITLNDLLYGLLLCSRK